MTYCLAACVDAGLVFVSDSRTNAGIDQLATFSKMHAFEELDGRFFTLLSSGNLATTQAVVARIHRDIRESAPVNLSTVTRMREAADYIGELSRSIQDKYSGDQRSDGFSPEAYFIFGGQIQGRPHALFQIYPEGNYVSPADLSPFVQIGEQKYGKPILDRIIQSDTALEIVARCGLVSMDSTMRSNASVGPPIELMIYTAGAPGAPTHMVFDEDDEYLRLIRESWGANLRAAFDRLPPISLTRSPMRIVDG
ncbi:MAG: peptidase [Pseudomonadota bacterium]